MVEALPAQLGFSLKLSNSLTANAQPLADSTAHTNVVLVPGAHLSIPAKSSLTVVVCWSPQQEGNVREALVFRYLKNQTPLVAESIHSLLETHPLC